MASGLLSNAALVGAATLLSRVTGFVRDVFIAALLGAGPLAEIFVIAFRLPNLFRRLFAEGALNAAFVPLYTQARERDGAKAAAELAGQIGSILLLSLVIFTGLAQVFMPTLVAALAQGFVDDGDKFALSVYYTRISFPYLIFMSLMALFAAMLNAHGRFFAAGFAPVLLNLVLIAAMGLAVVLKADVLAYLIYGVTLAGLAQFLFVLIAALRAGLRVVLGLPRLTENVRRMLALIGPGVLAAGIGQINLLVGTSIATGQQGAAAWLYYADRLYQLPMGVVGVALSTALLPELAHRLAIGDAHGARRTQDRAVLAAMALTLPAACGLAVLAMPIVSLLFERGAFSAADTQATAWAVQAFCLGLPAFVAVRALQPSFFARQDTRAPLIDGAIGVVVNVGLSLVFFPIYGHLAIAVATSVAGWVTMLLMLLRLHRRGDWHLSGGVVRRLGAQMLAALAMGVMLVFWVDRVAAPDSLGGLAFYVATLIGVGAMMFCVLVLLLGGVRRSDLSQLRPRP